MNLFNYLNGTKLTDVFELNLKSDEIIDLLERFDMDVIYYFDRLHEGSPDHYSAAALAEGLELRFDEHQVLETIWCYTRERDGFSRIDLDCIGTFVPSSFDEAKIQAIASGHRFAESADGTGGRTWLRFEKVEMWTHYEFVDGKLSLITLMRPWQ